MKFDSHSLRLYAVTDRAFLGEQTLDEQVEAALRGGVTCVQLREKSLVDEAFLKEARGLRELCKEYRVPFFINDHVGIAVASGADGVHVGQHDADAASVRAHIGPDMILGVSVQTVEQALLAFESGADYLGVGAVFATSTKQDADAVSLETLKNICGAVPIPVVAIGGITKQNLSLLSGTGIDGVALVSAIFGGADISSECRELLALSDAMVRGDVR